VVATLQWDCHIQDLLDRLEVEDIAEIAGVVLRMSPGAGSFHMVVAEKSHMRIAADYKNPAGGSEMDCTIVGSKVHRRFVVPAGLLVHHKNVVVAENRHNWDQLHMEAVESCTIETGPGLEDRSVGFVVVTLSCRNCGMHH